MTMQSELKTDDAAKKKDLIRHIAISSIKSYKKKYSKDYGDVVIASDGRGYWRKDFFPHYKASRKKGREASDLDWKFIFETLNEIREDIKKYFPYRVVHVDKCEADDVIAVLSLETQEFGKHEPVMIISSDKDFKQLQKYDNVSQFSPYLKKQIKVSKKELNEWMIEHIVKGDSGDGIPNILSSDDVFVNEERQKAVSGKRLDEFFKDGFNACKTDVERRNWHRNATLVSFEYIPEDVKKIILDEYEKPSSGDKNSVMNYLIKNKCRLLLDELEDF
jgi:5'-3' exonuclease, N-terminal resolvase-like domain/T4 RNase H, C terminal